MLVVFLKSKVTGICYNWTESINILFAEDVINKREFQRILVILKPIKQKMDKYVYFYLQLLPSLQ